MKSLLLAFGLMFGVVFAGHAGPDAKPRPVLSIDLTGETQSAEWVEAQLTDPLERGLEALPGVRSMNSMSGERRALIEIRFEPPPSDAERQVLITQATERVRAHLLRLGRADWVPKIDWNDAPLMR